MTKYIFPLLIALFALSSCVSDEKNITTSVTDIEIIDTITLPYQTSQCWNQFYHPVFKKSILTFIEENPLQIVSVDPETLEAITFPLDRIESEKNLSHPLSYYILDSNFAIVNFQNDKFNYFKIDRQGTECKIIPVKDNRSVKDYGLWLYNRLLPVYNSNNEEIILCLNFTADFEGNGNYLIDRSVRNKKFSAKTNLLLKYSDSLVSVYDEIGAYPAKLQNCDGYYYLEPEFCLSPAGKIVNIFPSINYLSVTTPFDSTIYYRISKKEIADASPMSSNNLFDYNYLSEYTYGISILLDIKSDSEDSAYYVISTIGDKYENADGTVNDPKQSPWILMNLDDQFNFSHSILFPKDKYSKHNFFFSSDFLFVLDYDLTKQNGKFTFVKFKKNWYV